ncbi:hypothetical protein [Tardiphaga sp. 841_E9_N1_2]|uniref:hypothetical protein n=1 Tax=Tardiphaga sp. 841_E9_N1_2 TaxID=3240762 RepID=UPI003F215400
MTHHREQHIASHHPRHLRIRQARDRNLRQVVTPDQRVDAGAEIDHEPEIGIARKEAMWRLPDKCLPHAGGVSDIVSLTKIDPLRGQHRTPRFEVIEDAVECHHL